MIPQEITKTYQVNLNQEGSRRSSYVSMDVLNGSFKNVVINTGGSIAVVTKLDTLKTLSKILQDFIETAEKEISR